jgi:hypothetical protein
MLGACGAQALQFYGLDQENKWSQLGYEATFFVLFFVLAWCAPRPAAQPGRLPAVCALRRQVVVCC